MTTGEHDRADPNGNVWPVGSREHQLACKRQPLCNGRVKLILGGGACDGDWIANYWRFPHFSRSDRCCWFCPPSRTEGELCQLTDCRVDAPFKDNSHAPDDDVICSDHVIMELRGATRHHYPGDWMHQAHAGVIPIYLG